MFSSSFFTISWVRTWRRRRCPLREDKYLRSHVLSKDRDINNSNKFISDTERNKKKKEESVQEETQYVCTDETWLRKCSHEIFLYSCIERLCGSTAAVDEKRKKTKPEALSLPHTRPTSAGRVSDDGEDSTTCYFDVYLEPLASQGTQRGAGGGEGLRRRGGETDGGDLHGTLRI